MKLNKIIIPLAVISTLALTTGATQAKDGPSWLKKSPIKIVVLGKDRKAPPKKKYKAPPKKVVVKKAAPKKSKGYDKKKRKH